MIRKITTAVFLILSLAGCTSSTSSTQENSPPPRRELTSETEKNYAETQFAVYDPAETMNRHIYKFNAELDTYVLLPIVDAYKYVTPAFVRRGVTNFFLNVGEATNFTNAVFQIKPDKAAKTLGRFVVNTTVGLAGTFDVATDMGIERQPEDFGETLGYWGAGSGAYIVLPILGPSNVRDTLGTFVDYATLYVVIPNSVKDTTAYDVVAYGIEPINQRYNNNFRYFSTGSPFEYELVRYIVTQSRTQEIKKQRDDRTP